MNHSLLGPCPCLLCPSSPPGKLPQLDERGLPRSGATVRSREARGGAGSSSYFLPFALSHELSCSDHLSWAGGRAAPGLQKGDIVGISLSGSERTRFPAVGAVVLHRLGVFLPRPQPQVHTPTSPTARGPESLLQEPGAEGHSLHLQKGLETEQGSYLTGCSVHPAQKARATCAVLCGLAPSCVG